LPVTMKVTTWRPAESPVGDHCGERRRAKVGRWAAVLSQVENDEEADGHVADGECGYLRQVASQSGNRYVRVFLPGSMTSVNRS
jgi:hypothetical protein